MRKIKTLTVCIALASVFGLSGCVGNSAYTLGDYTYEKTSDELLTFESSDSGLDFFLNDYFKRHVGYVDEDGVDWKVTSVKAGVNARDFFYQEWNSLAFYYFNSFDGLETDRLNGIRSRLASIPVDNYGNVWASDDNTRDALQDLTNAQIQSLGWPFPATTAEYTGGRATSWDFNGNDQSDWSSNISAVVEVGSGLFAGTTETEQTSVEFVSPLLDGKNGMFPIYTQYCPILELDLRMYTQDYKNIDDIYIWYKNDASESWSEEKRVSVGEEGFLDYAFTSVYEHILYLPMYAQDGWSSDAKKTISQIKVEVKAKDGTTLSGKFGLNYVHSSFDTRHTNNNTLFISSLRLDYDYTGDVEFLKENIVKARKAMNFFMQMYDPQRHLNNQAYLYGHDGDKGRPIDMLYQKVANSLTNGYWDIMFMPQYDFQSNVYFYKALVDMAYLESVVEQWDESVDKSLSTVKTATRKQGYSTADYTYDSKSLQAIANDVLSALRQETNDQTHTGFFDRETGRFIAGYDVYGTKYDYGYTAWNMEAVVAGVASDEQAKSIMDWISGRRIVESDRGTEEQAGSVGEDIYFYELAPRTITKNEKGLYNGVYDEINHVYGTQQCQFGGAIMYTSYYDLRARMSVYGAEDAFSRLKGIQSWYEKVYAYSVENNVKKQDFYWDYYESTGYTSQCSWRTGGVGGTIGIEGEFLESLLPVAAVPYAFFGLQGGGDVLTVSPELPESLSYWKMENLAFNFVKYDLTALHNAISINSVRGDATGLQVRLELSEPSSNYSVYVNGRKTSDYTVEDGKVIVIVPFTSVTVEVK